MPAPLRVDWDIAKSLFLGGLSISDVAHKTGISYEALRQRAHRLKWKDKLEKNARSDACHGVTDPVTRTVTSVTVEDARAMLKSANAWKHRVIKLADRHLAAVEARDPVTLKLQDFEALARITDNVDRVARRSFGLDIPASSHSTVLVNVQGDASSIRQLPESTESKVIDVESVPSQDTKQDNPA